MAGGHPGTDPLIVVLPGIGGSVLRDAKGAQVWGPDLTLFSALRHPDRLAYKEPLTPTALLPQTRPLGFILAPGYDDFFSNAVNLLKLRDCDVDTAIDGRDPKLSARMLFFPYDFRQGMEHNGRRLAAHVDSRIRDTDRRVMIIAHSMGGLVARWWWACEGGWKVCDHLYTVGTPHRGAPKALDYLGLGVGPGPLRFKKITDVLREWPSVYELLPRYPAVVTDAGHIYPHELPEAVSDLNLAEAHRAFNAHLTLENAAFQARAKAPDMVFRAIRSYAHPTKSWAWLKRGRLRVGARPPGEPEAMTGGDGTVPWFSALPVDYDGDALQAEAHVKAATARHSPLMSTSETLSPLSALARGSTQAMRGEADHDRKPALGLALDDVVLLGPISLTVIPDMCSATSMTATLLPGGRTVVMAQGQEGWTGELYPPSEGVFTVRVDAAVISRTTDSLHVSDKVAVVSDGE